MSDDRIFTMDQLAGCVTREMKRREQIYPELVRINKMNASQMADEIAMMRTIAEKIAVPAMFENFVVRGRLGRIQGVFADRAELVMDARIPVPGWVQPRLVEIRLAAIPMTLNLLAREADRMLGDMNDDGGPMHEGDVPTAWRRSGAGR